MGHIKQQFSIKDLEQLSGIKAHTIRIWEKRYGILQPKRTDTNIRYYDLKALQRILNIALLNENGYKISRIAKMNPDEVKSLIKSVSSINSDESRAMKAFKLAMINFDVHLFNQTYNSVFKTRNFREIFKEHFLPLLEEIGTLWQTNTIHPAQEHFITNLIRQKIYWNIERLDRIEATRKDKLFVLFLPEGEIHDLGILYLNYELLALGYKVIFLGHSLPFTDLKYLAETKENIHFVSYLTVKPDNLHDFLEDFQTEVSSKISCQYWLLGRKCESIRSEDLPENIKHFKTTNDFIKNLHD
ncbi:MerR family transcriptional regulator [Haloflavibacter putidus]|uniref:MerR family transcriptional regulator n=1 Tax=Haloflavibacter putidus TaxID=2576776 RepID=A0A507ZSE5_9FLAO|nr:MerR family transcriptional regulator [Haloflavibacter putidus]TQD38638.1 MerR family transcriptional regulator [Haloflavibacter putidus]